MAYPAALARSTPLDGRLPPRQARRMLRRLYDRTLRIAESPNAMRGLAGVSFVESSVFPIPPDLLMIPMILARPARAWRIAFVTMVASVLGGLLGYAIGALFFEEIGRPVLEFYGKADRFDEFAAAYNQWGAWAVLIAGVTPFPYKVITILSGFTGLDIWVFLISSLLARGLRFYVVAALLWRFGEPVRGFIERRLGLVFSVFLLLLLGGFALLRYV
ncbi:MAG: DedA family protein [Rhodobacteraceae bacterium]|nr:DedA family protein [Paracoccaceae bacterium]